MNSVGNIIFVITGVWLLGLYLEKVIKSAIKDVIRESGIENNLSDIKSSLQRSFWETYLERIKDTLYSIEVNTKK